MDDRTVPGGKVADDLQLDASVDCKIVEMNGFNEVGVSLYLDATDDRAGTIEFFTGNDGEHWGDPLGWQDNGGTWQSDLTVVASTEFDEMINIPHVNGLFFLVRFTRSGGGSTTGHGLDAIVNRIRS
jgi:hypothetical protein